MTSRLHLAMLLLLPAALAGGCMGEASLNEQSPTAGDRCTSISTKLGPVQQCVPSDLSCFF